MGAKRGVALLTLGNLAVPIASFLSAPILARALTVDERGHVASATATAQLVISLFSLGLPDAVTYFTSRASPHSRTVLARAVTLVGVLGLLGTIVTIIVAPLIAPDSTEVQSLISLAALAIAPTMVLTVVRGWSLGEQQWGTYMADSLVGPFARLAVLAVLVVGGALNTLAAVITILATGLLGIVVYWRPWRRLPKSLPGESSASYGQLSRYGLSVWAGSVSGVLLSLLDQVLMTSMSTAYQLGIYAVSVSLSQIVLVFNSAIKSVFVSLESKKPDIDRLAQAARISTLLTVTACALVAVVAPIAVPMLFGDEYNAAVIVVQILLLSTVLGNPGSVAGAGLLARGKPGLRSASMIIACVANVALIFLLVPSLGAVGAAWATVAAGFLAGNLNVVFMRLAFGVSMRQFYGVRKTDLREVRKLVTQALTSLRRKGKANDDEG